MKNCAVLLRLFVILTFVLLGWGEVIVNAQDSKSIDSIKKELPRQKDPQQRMLSSAQLGKYYEFTDLDLAAYYYGEALALAEKQNALRYIAMYNLNLSRIEVKRADLEKAENHCAQAIQFSVDSEDDSLIVVSNLIYAKIKIAGSQFAEVLPILEPTLERATQSGDSLLIAECYDAYGAYYYFSDVAKSIDYYIQSLRILEKYEENETLLTKISNVGSLYGRINQNEKAIEYFLKAVGIAERTNHEYTKSTLFNNLAAIYFAEGDNSKSKYYLEEALKIARQLKDERTICGITVNLGELYQQEKQFEKAMEYYQAGLYNPAIKGMPDQEVYTLYNIANLYFQMEEFRKTIQFAEDALELAKQHNISLHNVELYKLLALAYEKVQDYKTALANQKLYQTFSDSLFNIQSTGKIAEIQSKYDFDVAENENVLLKKENEIKSLAIERQKNRQILLLIILLIVFGTIVIVLRRLKKNREINVLLTAKNEEINLKSQELEKLNWSKDKFFSILAHDLRNPFNSILGSLEILSTEYPRLDETDRLQLIQLTHKSALATNNLLTNLLDWSTIQRGGINLEKDYCDIAPLIQESVNIHQSLASQKEITIDNQILNGEKAFVDKKSILVTFNNLINNAIKFTPPKGKVTISSDLSDGFIHIRIKDTGIGIPPEILRSLFRIEATRSRPGTNQEPGTGLGLFLCKDFTELNGGKISVTSEVNAGSSFQVSLPVAE